MDAEDNVLIVDAEDNVHLVQQLYVAFGRGLIDVIIDKLADDVEWYSPGPPEVIPWAGRRCGRNQVKEFFALLAEGLKFEEFEPREFIAQRDKVVVLGHSRTHARTTNRAFEQDWAMAWTLRKGKVVSFRLYGDTAATVAALRHD